MKPSSFIIGKEKLTNQVHLDPQGGSMSDSMSDLLLLIIVKISSSGVYDCPLHLKQI